jgi:hypothetical protein
MLQAISDRLTRSATIALLLSPAGLLIIAAARLLIISDYNTATASAIVSSSGYVNTLLGTIIPLVPIIMPYLALILLFFNRVAFALLMLFGAGFNNSMRTIATIVCVLLIPTVARLYPLPFNNGFYEQFVRQPWLPAETFTLSSGQKIVGYDLSDNGDWTEILLDDTRAIHFYPAGDVTGRQACQIGQTQITQPLFTLISGGTSVSPRSPTCQASPAPSSSPAPPCKPILPIRGPRP